MHQSLKVSALIFILYSMPVWSCSSLYGNNETQNCSTSSSYGVTSYGYGNTLTISNGTTLSVGMGVGVYNLGYDFTFINNGTILTTNSMGFGYYDQGSATGTKVLTNNNAIVSEGMAIYNQTKIGILTNTGFISGKSHIAVFYNQGNVDTINNIGSFISNSSTMPDIYSQGTISTLNNAQGAGTYYTPLGGISTASGPLSYEGRLPNQYNIIINSLANYGQLSVPSSASGTTTFGIDSGSVLTNGVYSSVLSGLGRSDIANASLTNVSFTSANSGTGAWTLTEITPGTWDLFLAGFDFNSGPSAADTQATIRSSAQKLRGIFNTSAISSNFANMNTYDCNLFDTKGVCISAGGRYTTVENPNSNSSSAVVVVGYKATPNIRVGGFLDQNVNNNTPTGIKVSNKNPLMGIFAVWNQKEDHLGYQIKIANAYQDKNVTATRDVIGTSEAGTGSSNLNTQSYVGELSYAFRVNEDKTTLRRYLALRQTTIKQDAYTETGVNSPLSYAALKDRSTTALVGLKINHALIPKVNLTASLGIEHDLKHRVGQYTATSSDISGLTSENFNDSIKRTRPVASAGSYYALSKTQRISGDVYYQQLPFQSTGSTTAYFSYMIGL